MLSRLRAGWKNLTRDDKRLLLLLEFFVLAASSVPWLAAPDRKSGLLAFALVFGIAQSVVVILIGAIAYVRYVMAPTTKKQIEHVVGWAFGAWMFYAVGGYVADWMFPDNELAIKWHYSLVSKVHDPVYLIDKRPHDCEFMSAPLGDKHCHYDRHVLITAADDGQSIVSVSWARVEE